MTARSDPLRRREIQAVCAACFAAGPVLAQTAPAEEHPDAPRPEPSIAFESAARADAPAPESLEFQATGAAGEAEGPQLELYGFADFTYLHVLGGKDSNWDESLQPAPSFYIGHLNLYMSSALSATWRSLMEVRFTYAPAGNETVNPDGTTTLFNATADDPSEARAAMPWGGINIERAWLEYEPYAWLVVRAGSWFTPYGFYNDDHGTPTILSLRRPFIIADQPFPARQAGLHVRGTLAIDSIDLGYDLTLSNGRGTLDQFHDWDNNKAIGGRLSLDYRAFGDLHVGVAAYKGRYSAARRLLRLTVFDDAPAIDLQLTTDAAYREVSFGGEARYRLDDFMIQGEITMNEAAFDEGARPSLPELTSIDTFAADYRRWGFYVLTGYTLPWLSLTPFVLYEKYNFANSSILEPVVMWSGGLNMSPTPGVALKASYMSVSFSGAGSTGFGSDTGRFVAAQAAWAF